MPRQNHSIEGLIPGKIRKRGCSSPASSSSSVIQNYRFKRAILVGKRGGSSTPVPTWRLMGTRSPAASVRGTESPRYTPSQCGSKVKQAPVSARKLAATLWEMNELPSPRLKEGSDERRKMKKDARGREKVGGSVRSGSLPPHLSDPSHSPISERMDRSETGSRRRRTQSVSNKLKHMDNNIGVLDSISSASLMEVETRSQVQTPSGSTVGAKTRLKDVSNALTTSKELLKIINRMWGHEDHPSSSMSLISALHAELERARLQVNHIIQEQRSDRNEINYLMKCFAEEEAAWKSKEHEVVEAAIESVAGELEVERKLRRRFESLNKKLGRELAETKTSLTKMVKELESEKRTREIMEQVCNELARDVGEDKAEVLELKRESAKVLEEVEKEREMMQLADVLREERVQMKLSEAKHQLEEKNAAVEKLRSQLEVFLGTKKSKQKGRASASYRRDDKIAAYLSNAQFGSHKRGEHNDDGEVEDRVDCEEESGESDLHSIELNMDDNNKSCKLAYAPRISQDSRRSSVDEIDLTKRDSVSRKGVRRSTSLQRTASDGVDWAGSHQDLGNFVDHGRFSELERKAQSKMYADEMYEQKSARRLRDKLLSDSRAGIIRSYASPTRQWAQLSPSRDHGNAIAEKPPLVPVGSIKSRLAEVSGEFHPVRKSKR